VTRYVEWLDASTDGRVVSTASRPPFRRVEDGNFSADLYYRLNTIRRTLDADNRAGSGQ
jgi:DNA-binding NtrC family response regulator